MVVLLAAAALRGLVTVAYQPALEFYGDSYNYLAGARHLLPNPYRPLGYSFFLRALSPTGTIAAVPVAQHALALVTAGLLYALLLRLGLRRWLAVLAVVPFLFDGYQLGIEQFVMAETLFELLLVGAVCALLWRRGTPTTTEEGAGPRTGSRMSRVGRASRQRGRMSRVGVGPLSGGWKVRAGDCALAGLLLAMGALTRITALPLLAVLGTLVLVRLRWRAFAAFGVAAAVPLLAYSTWFAAVAGHFGIQESSGEFLYGRVAPFAVCRHDGIPPTERALCPTLPPAARAGPNYYVWGHTSPLHRHGLGKGPERNARAQDFSLRVIAGQPLDYLRAAGHDTWHYFTPGRWASARDWYPQSWRFPAQYGQNPLWHVKMARVGFDHVRVAPHVDWPLAAALRDYQAVCHTPGPVLAACTASGLAAGLGLASRQQSRRRLGWAALVLALGGITLVAVPSLTTGFDYRYGLPLLVFLPPAGAVGVELALRSRAVRATRPEPTRRP